MKKSLCLICLVFLLSAFPWSTQGEGASTAAPFTIHVQSEDGIPIGNAYVSLWDHSAVPSRQVADAITDGKGLATFTTTSLNFADKSGELYQHLAVMVTAPGYETGHMSWSLQFFWLWNKIVNFTQENHNFHWFMAISTITMAMLIRLNSRNRLGFNKGAECEFNLYIF